MCIWRKLPPINRRNVSEIFSGTAFVASGEGSENTRCKKDVQEVLAHGRFGRRCKKERGLEETSAFNLSHSGEICVVCMQ